MELAERNGNIFSMSGQKSKIPKKLVEKLDEYEDVHGRIKRPAVTFIIQTFEDNSCPDIEVVTGRVDNENEVRCNLSSETRRTFIKFQKEEETLISVWQQANKKEKAYEMQDDILVYNDVVCGEPIKQVLLPAC
ncbi:hypothetical protein TNCV_954681 [Trichonephila clavipes]|nr:hypothetical protein TNCV_954681 [Trichonephila clavipes]